VKKNKDMRKSIPEEEENLENRLFTRGEKVENPFEDM
jgi:hypothetical protein